MEKSVVNEVSITKIPIKKEILNDDIKEYAETAMNELLGWYGYENNKEELNLSRKYRSHSISNGSEIGSPKSSDDCGWCKKKIDENNRLTSASASFCSELCFSQSRRANFKKNKTCDWCKHVRHTVSYVDFQDGASQLQFCSDKCLNQYKMHIFCRETTAHLELHPHMHSEESSSSSLITPDLWLKNCKSPEIRSPSPTPSQKSFEKSVQLLPLPLISVTHPSKLIEIAETKRNRLKTNKKIKRRLPATVTCDDFMKSPPCDMPQDLRVRHSPVDIHSNDKFPQNSETITQNDKPDDLSKSKASSFTEKDAATPNIPPPEQINMEEEQTARKKIFEKLLPPPTILYPYPIFLPVPIPIPIPIPIPTKKTTELPKETKDVCIQTETNNEEIKIDTNHKINNNTEVIDVVVADEIGPPRRLMRKRKKNYEIRSTVKNKRLCNSSK